MATITIPAKDLLVYTQIAREEIIKKYGDRIVQAMKELSERNFIVQFFSPNYDSVHHPPYFGYNAEKIRHWLLYNIRTLCQCQSRR